MHHSAPTIAPGAASRRSPARRRGVAAILSALVIAAGAVLAAPLPAQAQGAGTRVAPAALTAADREDIQRIERYLADIGTLQARFVQVASNGSYAEGTFYLSRPGKLRFEYAPPSPLLIVADGYVVYYYDTALKQTSQVPINLSPLAFLLRDRVQLTGGDLTVTRVERGDGVIRLSLVESKDPGAGTVTLAFSGDPLALRQWSITDAQGITTNIALTEVRRDVRLDSKLFVFDAPGFRNQ